MRINYTKSTIYSIDRINKIIISKFKRCKVCFKTKHFDEYFFEEYNIIGYGVEDECIKCLRKKYKLKNKLDQFDILLKRHIWEVKTNEKKEYYDYLSAYKLNNPEINFKQKENDSYRNIFYTSIKNKKASKSFVEMTGCSDINIYISHLEKQFTDKINWDTYGKSSWHIDHIIALSLYDLNIPSEKLKCFNYRNFRPLTAKENRIKRAFLDLSLIEKHNIFDLLPKGLNL